MLHPAKDRCEFFFHYDYGSLILAGIKFKESISASDHGTGSLSNVLTANINLQCESSTGVAAQSRFQKILNQQQPSDIVIGGDLACIEQLYPLLPPHSPSSEFPTTLTFILDLFPLICKLLLRAWLALHLQEMSIYCNRIPGCMVAANSKLATYTKRKEQQHTARHSTCKRTYTNPRARMIHHELPVASAHCTNCLLTAAWNWISGRSEF